MPNSRRAASCSGPCPGVTDWISSTGFKPKEIIMAISAKLPSRLHHTAFTSRDLEATRHFYEDIIGLPLVATWCEKDELFGKERVYCHCFFGLADGGALAFFQFADKEDADLF